MPIRPSLATRVSSSPGRPRREGADDAILSAAAALLDEKGYAQVTVAAVAARAGVGKQSLYRRWPSKAALVLDALAARTAREVPVPDTGSTRDDVRALLQAAFAVLRDPARGRVVASLMAEAQHDSTFAAAFRERFVDERRAVLATLLRRGIVYGDLAPETDIGLAVDLVYGAMWYRLLNQHAPLDDEFAAKLVNAVLR